MKKQPKYSPEVIERGVRTVSEAGSQYESQWAAITSIAAKIGCTPETLRRWVRQQERDTGQRPRPASAEEERVKALEREPRELHKANEILRPASAFFAQAEFGRHFKS
jgi:transposase